MMADPGLREKKVRRSKEGDGRGGTRREISNARSDMNFKMERNRKLDEEAYLHQRW
jgi:hypothetical protein